MAVIRAGEVRVEMEPLDGPVATELIERPRDEYRSRPFPDRGRRAASGPSADEEVLSGSSGTGVTRPEEFAPPRGLFLVAYVDGAPVACGGWRAVEGDAEIKRMFVDPAARGLGLARRILAELERAAAGAGHTRMILETGTRMPEAIGLYESSGYTSIPNYTIYRDEPASRCYGKALG